MKPIPSLTHLHPQIFGSVRDSCWKRRTWSLLVLPRRWSWRSQAFPGNHRPTGSPRSLSLNNIREPGLIMNALVTLVYACMSQPIPSRACIPLRPGLCPLSALCLIGPGTFISDTRCPTSFKSGVLLVPQKRGSNGASIPGLQFKLRVQSLTSCNVRSEWVPLVYEEQAKKKD